MSTTHSVYDKISLPKHHRNISEHEDTLVFSIYKTEQQQAR